MTTGIEVIQAIEAVLTARAAELLKVDPSNEVEGDRLVFVLLGYVGALEVAANALGGTDAERFTKERIADLLRRLSAAVNDGAPFPTSVH